MPHHMIDIRELEDVFTAGDYEKEARRVLDELRIRRKVPILVGGRGCTCGLWSKVYLKGRRARLFGGIVWRHWLSKRAGPICIGF